MILQKKNIVVMVSYMYSGKRYHLFQNFLLINNMKRKKNRKIDRKK